LSVGHGGEDGKKVEVVLYGNLAEAQMKKRYLPIIALVVGFIWAFITAGLHSMLFVLLPLLAFVFGYFSAWWWGLLNGFLLFLGCTFATALMWFGIGPNLIYPLQYFYAFIFGGFSLLLIGALAPVVRSSIRNVGSVVVLVVLAFFMVWCGFQAWPAYSYYYQLIIQSSENLEDLELYLPLAYVSGSIYEELLDNPLEDPMAPLTRDYHLEIVDTEHGPMLKFVINQMQWTKHPELPYVGNVIFWQPGRSGNRLTEMIIPWQRESAPHQLIKLMPRYDVIPVSTVESQEFRGPVKVRESKIIEEFKVPIMVKSGTDADFELRLENRTGRGVWINFTYDKSNTYTELIRYEGSTSDEWLLIPVEVTDRLSIRGIGD
jgi:hypothetical protein